MRRRLLIVALLSASALGGLWIALVFWGNSVAARELVAAELVQRLGVPAQIDDLRVGWKLDVRAHGVKIQDPRQQQLLSFPKVHINWRVPLGDVAPLEVTIEGGQVWFREANWQGYRFPAPGAASPGRVRSLPESRRPSLARTDRLETPPSPLLAINLVDVAGVFQVQRIGAELPFQDLSGRVRALSGDHVELRDLSMNVAGKIPLQLSGDAGPREVKLQLGMGEASLSHLSTLAPLSVFLVTMGISLDGTASFEGSLEGRHGQPPVVEGKLRLEQAQARLGGMRMFQDLTGSWKFRTAGEGVAGDLVLSGFRSSVAGLPLVVESATGRLEAGGGVLRIARVKGTCPLGALRGAFRIDVRQGLDWSLDLQVHAPKGSWLSGATFLASPAELRIKGVALQGQGLDVVLESEILPEQIEPPTWRMQNVSCYGLLRGKPVQLTKLAGALYVDNQGGHSFNLEGEAGKLMGQLKPDQSLKLWIQREPGAANESVAFPPPQR